MKNEKKLFLEQDPVTINQKRIGTSHESHEAIRLLLTKENPTEENQPRIFEPRRTRSVGKILARVQTAKGKPVNSKIKQAYKRLIFSKEHGKYEIFPEKKPDKNDKAKRPKTQSNFFKKKEVEEPSQDTFLDQLQKRTAVEFDERIALYNRFYMDYLAEPEHHFQSSKDLALDVRPLTIKYASPEQKEKFFNQVPRKLSQSSPLIQSLKVPFQRPATHGGPLNKKDNNTQNSTQREINKSILPKEEYIQQRIESITELERMLSPKGSPLDEKQREFLKAVKEGDTITVISKLGVTPSLVHLRDYVNTLKFCLILS